MDATRLIPPLLGDGNGRYRVHIVGNSGTGKSTLGAELAALLGVPYISLDALFWLPNWEKTPRDEFKMKVITALAQSERGWVADGNYSRRLGSLIQDGATDVVWLDPPFLLYFPRLCLRTLGRLLGLQAQCSPGCDESARRVFLDKNSIVLWCITQHIPKQKSERELFAVDGIHVGGKRRRIGGWGRELRQWKEDVRAMLAAANTN